MKNILETPERPLDAAAPAAGDRMQGRRSLAASAALFALVSLYPLKSPSLASWGSIGLPYYAVALALFCACVAWTAGGLRAAAGEASRALGTPLGRAVTAFWLLSAASVAWSPDRVESLKGLAKFASLLVFFTTLSAALRRKEKGSFAAALGWAACAGNLFIAAVVYLRAFEAKAELSLLLSEPSVMTNPSILGVVMADIFGRPPLISSHVVTAGQLLFFWLLGLAVTDARRARWSPIYAGIVLFTMPAFFLALSRTTWLALAAVLAGCMGAWLLRRGASGRAGTFLRVGLSALALTALFNPTNLFQANVTRAVGGTVAIEEGNNSTGERVRLVKGGLSAFLQHPLLGNGLWSSHGSLQKVSNTGQPSSAHCLYVQTLADLGLAGFCLLGLVFLLAFAGLGFGWRRLPEDPEALWLGAMLFSYAVSGLLLYQFMELEIWLPLALANAFIGNKERA